MWHRAMIVLALTLGLTGCSAQAAREESANLAGTWRLDAASSTLPERPERPGGLGQTSRFRDSTERAARWGGRRRFGQGPGRGMRGGLPDLLVIRQAGTTVTLADSMGAAMREIATGTPPSNPEGEARRSSGAWKGGVLTVERGGRRGSRSETFALADGGRTLVIETTASRGDGEAFTAKRVYRRVGS